MTATVSLMHQVLKYILIGIILTVYLPLIALVTTVNLVAIGGAHVWEQTRDFYYDVKDTLDG